MYFPSLPHTPIFGEGKKNGPNTTRKKTKEVVLKLFTHFMVDL